MTTYVIAALVTLAFTIVLTVAGLGAAFILVPIYLALGVEMHSAQATALLLNAIAMAFACIRYIPAKLVDFRVAIPIVVIATALSPLGAYTSSFVPVTTLKWLFVGFLVFAGAMMLFYKPKSHEPAGRGELVGVGVGVGGAAGFLGGHAGRRRRQLRGAGPRLAWARRQARRRHDGLCRRLRVVHRLSRPDVGRQDRRGGCSPGRRSPRSSAPWSARGSCTASCRRHRSRRRSASSSSSSPPPWPTSCWHSGSRT